MFHPNHPLHLVLGPIIWAGWFVGLYASLSVACSLTPPAASQGALTWINGTLLVLTGLVGLLLMALGYRCWRHASAAAGAGCARPFVSRVASGIYLLTAVSTFTLGVPMLLLPPCI